MIIYHICKVEEWESRKDGYYEPGSYLEEGFVHFSNGFQIAQTYERYFHGKNGLLCLSVDVEEDDENLVFADLTGSGEEFPHYHDRISVDMVKSVIPIPEEAEEAMRILSGLE